MGEREGVERRGEGKEKVEGMTEGRGKEGMWYSDGGGLRQCSIAGIDATGPTAQAPGPIFTRNTSNDAVPRKDVPFRG